MNKNEERDEETCVCGLCECRLEVILNKKYGPFMNVSEYAELMKIKPDTVYKQIANGTVDVGPIINEARRKHLFPTQLVAEWIGSAIEGAWPPD